MRKINGTTVILELSFNQEELVRAKTLQEIAKLELAYKKKFPDIEIRFDLKGRAAGQFSQRRKKYFIRYNVAIFKRYFKQNLDSTIAHEVGHFAVQVLYPRRRLKPHGIEWREVMAVLGADDSVCHQFDLAGLPQRKERRFSYHCACQEHQLSCRKHNKIQAGKVQYFCRLCGSSLRAIP